MPEDLAGPLTDDQAAKGFEEILAPRPKAAAPKENARAEPEGDDNPDDNSEEEPEGPEPEEEAEEGEEEPEADDGDSEVTITVDGRNQKIKLRELQDGYLRRSDYQTKTKQLADERRAFQSEVESTKSEREKYGAMLGQLRTQMDALMPQEPDWNALLQQQGTDAYLRTRLQWDAAQKKRAEVEAEYQRVAEQGENDRREAARRSLEEEHGRMIEAIPEWKNQKVMEKERTQMVDWAKRQGFSDDDIGQISDHRAVNILRLAWIGHRMIEAKAGLRPVPEPQEVKPAKPLAQPARVAATGIEAAKRRLAQSGSDEDATALFQMMEPNRRRRA